jgi:orotidine-5'-phosphate decarboxylase
MVALDTSDVGHAEDLAGSLAAEVGMLKVGLELFWTAGPAVIGTIAAHGPVFADAKLHDIPTTVGRTAERIAAQGAAMLDVHAAGGVAMMREAVRGAARGAELAGTDRPLVIAVTVLSSSVAPTGASVELAERAQEAGLDGVVVSGEDVASVRRACGDDFCLVVPGIRSVPDAADDQVRVLGPREAIDRGADYLVIGRPITAAPDPLAAVREVNAIVRRS